MAKTIKLKIGTTRHRLVIEESRTSCYGCSLGIVCDRLRGSEALCNVLMDEAEIYTDKKNCGHFEIE